MNCLRAFTLVVVVMAVVCGADPEPGLDILRLFGINLASGGNTVRRGNTLRVGTTLRVGGGVFGAGPGFTGSTFPSGFPSGFQSGLRVGGRGGGGGGRLGRV